MPAKKVVKSRKKPAKDWDTFLNDFQSLLNRKTIHHPHAHMLGANEKLCHLCDKTLPTPKEIFYGA